jgi:hypothetical protein
MKRFLMLLAVAAVAGGMYVAAAPGRTAHAGPTWKQYTALRKQVAALKKQVGQVKKTAAAADGFIQTCFLNVVAVNEFGDVSASPQYGYAYTPQGGVAGFTTALDLDGSATPGAFLQTVDSSCVAPPGSAGHAQTHRNSGSHLSLRVERRP